MTGTKQCHHPELHIDLNHVCLVDSNTHYLEIKARCKVCGVRMQFQGAPLGLSPSQPTMALDGLEITIPMRGEGEEPAGMQISIIGRAGHGDLEAG